MKWHVAVFSIQFSINYQPANVWSYSVLSLVAKKWTHGSSKTDFEQARWPSNRPTKNISALQSLSLAATSNYAIFGVR